MNKKNWPEIYFVRHGQTDWNAAGRFQGRMDIPLNDIGRAQADANGPLLRQLVERDGRTIADIDWFASPLSRASETVQRVAKAFAPEIPEISFDDRLVEISFGEFEGRSAADLANEFPAEEALRQADKWAHKPPGGESYFEMTDRVAKFSERLVRPSVIVAHGGVVRVLRRLITGEEQQVISRWLPQQDAVFFFSDGKMTIYEA
ncbi:MAG: histidine phosphatase family protein [Alphaproteobacteria bacterium]|nr:histidine phosphatase family protein [Alphaproteobacteria bacterium]